MPHSDSRGQPISFDELHIEQVPVNAAIVDSEGRIVAVNETWRDFGRRNGLATENSGVGSLYCDNVRREDADVLCQKFHDLLSGRSQVLSYFYPCHSPDIQRWFFLIGRTLDHDDIGSNRSNVVNAIDSNHSERDFREKPVSTFSHPALAKGAILFHIDITSLLPAHLMRGQALPAAPMLAGELLEGIGRVVEASVAKTMDYFFMERGVPPSSETTRRQPAAASLDSLTMLSRRQRQVLALLAQGKSNEEIGTELSTSVNTVKLHVSAILRRLNLRSRTQAALFAMRLREGTKTGPQP